jgi:uncharacterized protein (TIRG00374 family)
MVQLFIWLLAAALLWFTLRNIPLAEVVLSLQQLSLNQLSVLVVINLLVLLSLSGRWWWILRSMGIKISYPLLSLYRLAAFSLSYFTPGPQFGGEPFQIYLLQRRHSLTGSISAAGVTLDKAIELLGNFTFLIFGVLIGLRVQFLPDASGLPLLYAALGLLLLPLIMLALTWSGRKPLTALLKLVPGSLRKRVPGFSRILNALDHTEEQISSFCCDRPQGLIGAMTFSLLTWVLLVVEYWLMSRYLGFRLDLSETIAVLTAARLAFLTPFPGAVGALEASQALALSALGYSPGQGLSMGILIRARDLLFGGLGLFLVFFYGRTLRRESNSDHQADP